MQKLTNDEAFSVMAKGLLSQKRRSVSERDWACRLRGSNGSKCAAGFLIDDDEYSPEMENSLPIDAVKKIEKLSDLDPFMIGNMIIIHDLNPVDKWPQKIRNLHKKLFSEGVLKEESFDKLIS